MSSSRLSLVFLWLALAAGNSLAADEAFLIERQYGQVAYLSGGIGEEERLAIRAREREFNLALIFAGRDGSYLGDVDVLISGPRGETVLEAYAVGPFLLARVPSGRYRIKAMAEGTVQRQELVVGGQPRHERVFRW